MNDGGFRHIHSLQEEDSTSVWVLAAPLLDDSISEPTHKEMSENPFSKQFIGCLCDYCFIYLQSSQELVHFACYSQQTTRLTFA